MLVKFDNQEVHISRLRQGVVVEYEDDLYHIGFVHRTQDRRIKIYLQGVYEQHDLSPEVITWLEG